MNKPTASHLRNGRSDFQTKTRRRIRRRPRATYGGAPLMWWLGLIAAYIAGFLHGAYQQ